MEKQEAQPRVTFTRRAQIYFFEILEYLYEHYSLDRAEEIANEIHTQALSLNHNYKRGAIKKRLSLFKYEFRFLLYPRGRNKDIKIIYFYDSVKHEVVVTCKVEPTRGRTTLSTYRTMSE